MPVWYHLLGLGGCFVLLFIFFTFMRLKYPYFKTICTGEKKCVISNRQKQLLETVLGIMHCE